MPIMREEIPKDPPNRGRTLYYEHPRSMPMSLFTTEAGRRRCQANHGQSPERLAERGGLSVREAACILLGRSWREVRTLPVADAIKHLRQVLAEPDWGRQKAAQAYLEGLGYNVVIEATPSGDHVLFVLGGLLTDEVRTRVVEILGKKSA